MKTKKAVGCALALTLIASLTTPIQAAENGWKMSGGGVWNYTNVDGPLPQDGPPSMDVGMHLKRMDL